MHNPYKNVDISQFQKMVFIYNAVMNGWTVKQLDDGRYEFTKEGNQNLLTNQVEPSPHDPNSANVNQGLSPNNEPQPSSQIIPTQNDDTANDFLYKFIRNNMSLNRLKKY